MLKQVEHRGRSISESELNKITAEIGIELPFDYKAFLLKYNGGSPEPDAIPIKNHDEEVGTLQLFFGIDREIESSNLNWIYNEMKDRVPDSYLPIACSDTGDMFLLVLSKDLYGSVVFWDAMGETSKDNLDNIYKVSDDFIQLLELLFED